MAEAGGDLAQQPVADVMAQGVVDALEIVEVQEQHAHQPLVAPGPLDGVIEPVDGQQPVRQGSEAVVFGLILQFLDVLETLLFQAPFQYGAVTIESVHQQQHEQEDARRHGHAAQPGESQAVRTGPDHCGQPEVRQPSCTDQPMWFSGFEQGARLAGGLVNESADGFVDGGTVTLGHDGPFERMGELEIAIVPYQQGLHVFPQRQMFPAQFRMLDVQSERQHESGGAGGIAHGQSQGDEPGAEQREAVGPSRNEVGGNQSLAKTVGTFGLFEQIGQGTSGRNPGDGDQLAVGQRNTIAGDDRMRAGQGIEIGTGDVGISFHVQIEHATAQHAQHAFFQPQFVAHHLGEQLREVAHGERQLGTGGFPALVGMGRKTEEEEEKRGQGEQAKGAADRRHVAVPVPG